MYKITKKYEDFLGREVEETFRFNISETEMLDMLKDDPVFNPDYLLFLTKEPDGIKMIDVIRKLLVISYGELSDDAKHFWKDDQRTTAFVQSKAFEEILNDFLDPERPDTMKKFILGIFPAKYKEAAEKQAKSAEILPLDNK